MPRLRPALRSRARSWARVSRAASAGVGAAARMARASGRMMPPVARGEGGEEAGVVLAQVGAELVVRGDAVPDGVLLGAGQHRDGLGELGVGGQRPVRVQVGAQDVRQDDRVAVVGLAARDRVPVPVAGHRHRVDRVDRRPVARRQATSRPRGVSIATGTGSSGAVAVLGEQVQQPGQAGRVVADPQPGQQPAVVVHEGDVVVVFRPVDPAEYVQLSSLSSVISRCPCWPGPCRARALPNGRAQGPAIRLAVRDPSCPQAPVLARARRLPALIRGSSCGWLRPRPPIPPRPAHSQHPARRVARRAGKEHGRRPGPGSSTRGPAPVMSAGHPAPTAPARSCPALVKASRARIAIGINRKTRTPQPRMKAPALRTSSGGLARAVPRSCQRAQAPGYQQW